jgi:hypothetical protein
MIFLQPSFSHSKRRGLDIIFVQAEPWWRLREVMALRPRIRHESPHRERLARAHNASERPSEPGGAGPARNRRAPFFGRCDHLGHDRQSTHTGDRSNVSTPRRCHACRINPKDSVGRRPREPRPANHRRSAYRPAAMAEQPPGRVDNRRCSAWRPRGWPSG